MNDFKKYRNKISGDVVEAALIDLSIYDDNFVGDKKMGLSKGNLGKHYAIKGREGIFWKIFTFEDYHELL